MSATVASAHTPGPWTWFVYPDGRKLLASSERAVIHCPDVPLLAAEFKRAGVPFSMEGRRIVDPQAIFFKREPRDLTSALKFFCGETLEGAHRAEADVGAAIAVLAAQLERYGDLPATVDALHEYCRDASWVDESGRLVWADGKACIGFGKHAGRSLEELSKELIGRDYLRWVASADFPADTKRIIVAALRGEYPVPGVPSEVADAVV